jgi:hypothetical protein
MESIFEDLLNNQAYTLEAACMHHAEEMVWPIIISMFERNTCVYISGFTDNFLKRFLLPDSIEVNLTRDYYHTLDDEQTLEKIEQETIYKRWPLLVTNYCVNCLTISSSFVCAKSIQVVYPVPVETPKWTFVKIDCVKPSTTNLIVISAIPSRVQKSFTKIQKCAPFADICKLLKTGDCKMIEDASNVFCVNTPIEKQAVIKQSIYTNNKRTVFNNKDYPRWDWCMDFLYKMKQQKIIILTANELPSGLISCNNIVTLPGITKTCVHLDSITLGPYVNNHVQNVLDTFNKCGQILIITNANETCDSLAGNIPMWLRYIRYTDLILLDAAWQRWPLPLSVTNQVNVWKVIMGFNTCKKNNILFWVPVNEQTIDLTQSKFDEIELNRVYLI